MCVVLVHVLKARKERERSKRKPIVTTVSKNLTYELHRFLHRKNERSALYRRHQAIEKEEQKHIYVYVCIYRPSPSLSLSLSFAREEGKNNAFLVADRSIRHVRREEKQRRKRREKTRREREYFFVRAAETFEKRKKYQDTKRRDSRDSRERTPNISVFFFLSLPPLCWKTLFSKSFRCVGGGKPSSRAKKKRTTR